MAGVTDDGARPIFIADWETQARQYPASGPSGISYFGGETTFGTVDCLLYRNESGELVGILNHYPFDVPGKQVRGSRNIWVKSEWQRRGIGRLLVVEAVTRWGLAPEGGMRTAAGKAAAESWQRRYATEYEALRAAQQRDEAPPRS